MKTLKPLSLSVLHRVVEHGRRFYFTVTAAMFIALDDPAKPRSEVELWTTVPRVLGDAVLDEAMPKSRGEVIVSGSAYAPGGAASVACEARVRIGAVDKTVRVIGDRHWDARGVASAPTPFTEMPLRYTHAFGGDGFPLNPYGKGFSNDATAPCEGRALPNLEDPRYALRSPDDTVAPACFAAQDLTFAQRTSKLGTYDDAWLRDAMPGLALDVDWRAFNVAPEDQWLEGYFQGDETFALENLHPAHARIEGRLPGLCARVFVNRRGDEGERFEEIATRLDTVHFFPGAMRAVLLFRGVVEVVEDDADDVLQLLVGCERAGAPRDVAHYRRVLALRMDRATGAAHALREEDLMPEGLALSLDALGDGPKPQGLMGENVRRGLQARLDEARARIREQGRDPDEHLPKTLPEPPAPITAATLPAFIEEARAKLATQRADADRCIEEARATRARTEADVRAKLAARDIDYDAVRPRDTTPAGGPPVSLRARLVEAKAKLQAAAAQGVDITEAQRKLEDPTLLARLAQAEAAQLDGYRRNAHHMAPASPRDAAANARARAVIAARYASGEGFARWDLTGLDLSNAHLVGADLRDALLEGVDLRGANLAGADLTGATLARARLDGADLTGARFARANLGCASFAGALAREPVDFTESTVWQTDFSKAQLPGARFDGVRLFEAKLAGADLGAMHARKATFFRAELAGARLVEASLGGASFIECALVGADLSRASMKSAAFINCRVDDAALAGADLENLRVVQGSTFARADLTGARLPTATLRGTCFVEAKFTRCDLDGCDLSECDLTGASLDRVSARDARFVRAKLTGASLVGAGLLGAILQKATLTDAVLTDAVLFGADLVRTRGRPASLDGANLERARVLRGGA
ncbi:MAG: DUF2169 domain-containing protein [Polyangiales bacterium]